MDQLKSKKAVTDLIYIALTSYYKHAPDISLRSICQYIMEKHYTDDKRINNADDLWTYSIKFVEYYTEEVFDFDIDHFKSFIRGIPNENDRIRILITIRNKLNSFSVYVRFNELMRNRVDIFINLINSFIKESERIIRLTKDTKDKEDLNDNPFKTMDNLTWNEITINITTDDYIIINARNKTRRYKYKIFDSFHDKTSNNTSKPYYKFKLLGNIPDGTIMSKRMKNNDWINFKKSMSLISKDLKKFFSISDGPFYDPRSIGFHKPKFILKVDPLDNIYTRQSTIDPEVDELLREFTTPLETGKKYYKQNSQD